MVTRGTFSVNVISKDLVTVNEVSTPHSRPNLLGQEGCMKSMVRFIMNEFHVYPVHISKHFNPQNIDG